MKKILVVMSARNVRPGGGIIQMILNYKKFLDEDNNLEVDYAMNADLKSGIAALLKTNGTRFYQLPDKQRHTFSYMYKLYKICKGYDCVHAKGASGLLAMEMLPAWLADVPVRIVQSHNTACQHKYADKLLRPIMYHTATNYFACGEEAGRWLFGNREFKVIKNAKDLQNFKFDGRVRKTIRERYQWNEKEVLGHVGNFNYQKNYGFLLEIFKAVADHDNHWQFVLIGDGEGRKQIEKQICQMGLEEKVLFMGSISNMPEVLQAMDVMVLPSRFEGLPNVVLEWQTAGLPCLVSDSVTKECAPTALAEFMSLKDDAAAWAEKLMGMPMSVEKREEASNQAVICLKEAGYDISGSAKELSQTYLQLIIAANKKQKRRARNLG